MRLFILSIETKIHSKNADKNLSSLNKDLVCHLTVFLLKKTFSLYPREQKTSKKTSLFFLHDVTSGLVFFSKSPVN